MTNKPVLVFGYGNPSRGDDAIGPEFLRMIDRARLEGRVPDIFDVLTDFQLQVEHALDLEHRKLILFVDASVSASSAFEFSQVMASKDNSFTTHAMSPSALMAVYENVSSITAPEAFLLAIQGFEFSLGKPISNKARDNLENALDFAFQLLGQARAAKWQQMARPVAVISAVS
ncbi:MAG: hydrogenase maturation protease [Gammaproteobacteria bacterium]|nr:MAG: hydrogenase maturation protease [Gammaproteobacteria bacterium]